jgi:hypothetical protein
MKALLYLASAWGVLVDALLLLSFAQDSRADGAVLWVSYLLVSLVFYVYVGFVAHRQAPRPRTVGALLATAAVLALGGMIGGLVFFSGALLALFSAWMLSLKKTAPMDYLKP